MPVRQPAVSPSLNLERLDDRCLPSINFTNGTLTIFGTGGNDLIQVVRSGSQIAVGTHSFDAASIRMIVVDAGDGDDTVTIDPQITATTWLFGRLGNDRLVGGGGVNYLYGGHGDDVLMGGPGQNILVGGSGRNTLHAQPGDEVTPGQPAVHLAPSAMTQQILDLVNQQRANSGLAPLQWSVQLAYGAGVHSQNMASMAPVVGPSAAMSHLLFGVNAPTLGSRADLAGYDYRALGENVAFGYASASAVVDAWMNSPGHRANILSASFTQIGIAVAYSAQGLPYYTQFFGSPVTPAPISTVPSNSVAMTSPSAPSLTSTSPPRIDPSPGPVPTTNPSPDETPPVSISFRRTAGSLRSPNLAVSQALTSSSAISSPSVSPNSPVIRVESNSGSSAGVFSTTGSPAPSLPVVTLESRPSNLSPTRNSVPGSSNSGQQTPDRSTTSATVGRQVSIVSHRFVSRTFRWFATRG